MYGVEGIHFFSLLLVTYIMQLFCDYIHLHHLLISHLILACSVHLLKEPRTSRAAQRWHHHHELSPPPYE